MNIFSYFLASYFGIIALAYALSPVVRQAMFVARFGTAFFLAMGDSALGVVVALVLRPINKHRITQWVVARVFSILMWIFVGVKFQRTPESGERLRTRPAVYVANHQS
jgi:1-acyl-sn-glycerol-3-phosphate acyltransferase